MPAHKPFNHLTDSAMYFGNARQQKQIITTLTKATQGDGSSLHLVSGGSNSGKSYAIQQVIEKLDKDRFLSAFATRSEVEAGFVPDSIPAELQQHLEALNDELYTQHFVYEGVTRSGKKMYVVVADGETSPSERKSAAMLAHTAELVKNAPQEGYELVWIADAPIMSQVSPIFKQTPYRQGEIKKFEEGVKRLTEAFPEVVHTHRLNYDIKTTKESLWNQATTYGQPFIDYLKEETANWEKTPEWDATVKAALSADRDAYEKSFAVLAKRARQQSLSAA